LSVKELVIIPALLFSPSFSVLEKDNELSSLFIGVEIEDFIYRQVYYNKQIIFSRMEFFLEVAKNVFQLKLPIPDNPLGTINAYLIKTNEGSMLVDTGWNAPNTYETLIDKMKSYGVGLNDIRYIFITHIHPDHYGLVGKLESVTDSKLIIHKLDRDLLHSHYLQPSGLVDDVEAWLQKNGVPAETKTMYSRSSLNVLGYVQVAMPNMVVEGGERIRLGDFNFEIVWTPGHSPGHICLYEVNQKFLISGDHILEKITPNISLNFEGMRNPLPDYLDSFQTLRELDVELVLPAHGDIFTSYYERIDQIIHHHLERMDGMISLFNEGSQTGYQIAKLTKWYLPWEDLPMFSKKVAVTETLAHLELLVTTGRLSKQESGGVIMYSLPE